MKNVVKEKPLNGDLRIDGWQNVLTGMNIPGVDKNASSRITPSTRLDEYTTNFIYREDGLARRCIDLPVNDMIRAWFKVAGDTDGIIVKYLDKIKTREKIKKSLQYAYLFGGSICVMGIDDGQKLDQPVKENRIRRIMFLSVFSRWKVTYTSMDLYDDPTKDKFGEPQFYNVYPKNGEPFRVHESRVLRFDGVDSTETLTELNDGWNDSLYQHLTNTLKHTNSIYSSVCGIVNEFVISTLTINNLQDLIYSGQEELVRKRLQLIDLSKHIINTVLLDKEEKYTKESSTVTGLSLIVDKYIQLLCAINGIPVTVFMGESPAGLNATGMSDIRLWYDNVHSKQIEKMHPQLLTLIRYVILSADCKIKDIKPDDLSIEFNSLWQSTESEKINNRKKQAETDNLYISNGTLMPEEVALNRFGGNEYSYETTIESRSFNAPDNTGEIPDDTEENLTTGNEEEEVDTTGTPQKEIEI